VLGLPSLDLVYAALEFAEPAVDLVKASAHFLS
jgi:hypothetical protein